jgi:hypothetical protein
MSLWTHLITGTASAAVGAAVAVGGIYFAADSLLGETIDDRVTTHVADEVSSAQEEMAQAIARVLAQNVVPRIEHLEGRKFTVQIGSDCPLTLDDRYPEVVTIEGRAESICVVAAP